MSTDYEWPEMLSRIDGAAYMGVPEGTFNRLLRDGLLPYYKPGGKSKSRVLVAKKDIDAFLAATRVEAKRGPLAQTG